jgi:hypothetical protein
MQIDCTLCGLALTYFATAIIRRSEILLFEDGTHPVAEKFCWPADLTCRHPYEPKRVRHQRRAVCRMRLENDRARLGRRQFLHANFFFAAIQSSFEIDLTHQFSNRYGDEGVAFFPHRCKNSHHAWGGGGDLRQIACNGTHDTVAAS